MLTAAEYEAIGSAAVVATQALERMCRAGREDGDLRRALRVPSWQERALDLEPADVPPFVGRLDGLVAGDGRVRFIEYNTMPGGIYEMHALGRLFAGSLLASVDGWSLPDPFQALCRALAEDAEAAGQPAPRLAVIDWPPPGAAPDLDALASSLRSRGLPVQEAGPASTWTYASGGRLALDGELVNAVLFLDPLHLGGFLASCSLDDPLIRGLRAGSAHVLGGLFRTLFLASKRVFAALSDPDFAGLLPAEARPALDACIPWTRVLGERSSTYRGDRIELLPFCAANHQRLVLKPPLGQGGQGVVLGWRVTPEAWAEALQTGLADGSVVQERVESRRESYPLLRGGEVVFEELWGDVNPYVWRGARAQGCFVRVGADPLLNISAGAASIAGLMVAG